MMKILSVIVPSYNMEKYLPKCLGSLVVAPELMERLEVLVVNDGSKDQTSEIAHKFEARHPGVFRVIDKPNGNYGSCINAALPLVNGRFVKILDADDSFDTNAFKTYLSTLEGLPADTDMVMCDYVHVDESDVVTHVIEYPLGEEEPFTPSDLVGLKCDMAMHAIALRTELLREIGYRQSEGISYTDTEWFYLPVAACKKIRYVKASVYRYLVGRSGQTMEKSVWVKNRHMLERICKRMFSQYDLHDSQYAVDYSESQLLRVAALLVNIYTYYVPICDTCTFWDDLGALRIRYPFVSAQMSRMVLFSRLMGGFKYVDFILRHRNLRRICLVWIRWYGRVRRYS